MDYLSPFARQMIIASSPQLAAVSVGGVIGYPNILLEQFRSNESIIHADLDVASWIGSAHGIAGLPSIFMPTIMQIYGRKPAFITSCLIILLGWLITFLARTAPAIIIAEAFQGLGTNSIIIVSHFTVSEMVDPKYRTISMNFYGINQTLGVALVSIMGRYVYWRTLAYIMSVPMCLALAISFIWPESPSWLASTGEFEKCETSFLWLRGSSDDSKKELEALIDSQKFQRSKKAERLSCSSILKKITRKDFYVPSFHMFVCLCSFYCSGTLVVLIYAMSMIRTATKSESAAFYGMITLDVLLFFGCLFASFLIKLFNNKPVMIFSGFWCAIFLSCATLTTFLQKVGILSINSMLCLYFLLGFMVSVSLGVAAVGFSVAAEVMPVKHRDIGGSLYVIYVCVLHFASLKVYPYLFLYIGLSGTFLLYSLNATLCTLYVWRFVPETKNRSLHEIEMYYNYGCFDAEKPETARLSRG